MKKGLKKSTAFAVLVLMLMSFAFAGCGADTKAVSVSDTAEETEISAVAATDTAEETADEVTEESSISVTDGVYSVKFDTDSSMFHVNDVCEGRAEVVVENGVGTMHLIMPSKNILNLYLGLADDAQKEGSSLLMPGTEEVVYSDGFSDSVYTFDVPLTELEGEFDLALIGKKGTWYDHKVTVSDPVKIAEIKYAEVGLEGGTGKVTVSSPARVLCYEEGFVVNVIWSSSHYDYMIVDGVKFYPVSNDGCSIFNIPVQSIGEPLAVTADTTAMSTPHEIEYTLTFDLK